MTLTVTVPALALETVAGRRCHCRVERMSGLRYLLLIVQRKLKHAVCRWQCVVVTGIQYLRLGTRGKVFAGYISVKATVQSRISYQVGPESRGVIRLDPPKWLAS